MGNIFNLDFQDFIKALNEAEVDYQLLGGYAVILYGHNRTTGDMDIWIEPTQHNFVKMLNAFRIFGLPTNMISENDFLNTEDYDVFTFGRPPVSIDIMTKVKGLDFRETYSEVNINESQGFVIKLLSYDNLLKSKVAANRNKDLYDIQKLEEE